MCILQLCKGFNWCLHMHQSACFQGQCTRIYIAHDLDARMVCTYLNVEDQMVVARCASFHPTLVHALDACIMTWEVNTDVSWDTSVIMELMSASSDLVASVQTSM